MSARSRGTMSRPHSGAGSGSEAFAVSAAGAPHRNSVSRCGTFASSPQRFWFRPRSICRHRTVFARDPLAHSTPVDRNEWARLTFLTQRLERGMRSAAAEMGRVAMSASRCCARLFHVADRVTGRSAPDYLGILKMTRRLKRIWLDRRHAPGSGRGDRAGGWKERHIFARLILEETQHGPVHGWLFMRQRPNCGVGTPIPGRPLSLSRLPQASWGSFSRFRRVPSGRSDDRWRDTRLRRAVFLSPLRLVCVRTDRRRNRSEPGIPGCP